MLRLQGDNGNTSNLTHHAPTSIVTKLFCLGTGNKAEGTMVHLKDVTDTIGENELSNLPNKMAAEIFSIIYAYFVIMNRVAKSISM